MPQPSLELQPPVSLSSPPSPPSPPAWTVDQESGAEHRLALARTEDRCFHDLLNALPAAVYTTDAAGRITFFNEAAAELWGCRPELGRSEWCGSWRLLWPDGKPMRHDECPMAVTLREGRPVTGEAIAERPDGTRVPFAAYPKPLRDASGRMVGAVNTLVDIGHRKAHEQRQRLLINELNHRVKNTLATVQSIAMQNFRDVPDDQLRWFQGRLIALANAHDVLTRENWEGATIRELMATVLAPLSGPDSCRFEANGPNLRLSPRMVLSLSMALHELCTNAAKYGALSNETGRVTVQWSLADHNGGSRLQLQWQEVGGPPVKPPQRRGFGSRLLTRGVARELGAEVRMDFAEAGLICEIEAPLR